MRADPLRHKSPLGGVIESKIRMKHDMYETDAPGPGKYRLQSGFGKYSIEEDEEDLELALTAALKSKHNSLA